jgi:hypothetical protein
VEALLVDLLPSSGSQKRFIHFLGEFNWSMVFGEDKIRHSYCASLPPIAIILEYKWSFMPILSSIPLSSMFQDPTMGGCTQNQYNPFIGLGS